MAKKCLVIYLVIGLFIMGAVPRVDAAFAPSEKVGSAVERSGDMEAIRGVLENKLVAQRLQDLGYTQDEITSRLSEMTDTQIHALALDLDSLKVGQSGEWIIITLLLVIIVVLLVLYLTGKKVIVTK